MKSSKNFLMLTLMFSSIGLLLLLQFLWIRSSYIKAYYDLRTETNSIFRSTIFAMRDSSIQHTFATLPIDSAILLSESRRRPYWDNFEEGQRPDKNPGKPEFSRRRTGESRNRDHGRSTRTDSNSLKRNRDEPHPFDFHDRRDYISRLGPDSLKMDSIAFYFKDGLSKAGIHLPFQVVHNRRGDKRIFPKGSFISEAVRLNPLRRYSVVVSDYNSMLMREIMPQALFSIFLTLITTLAFYILFRSIQTQRRLVQLKNDFISNITHELKTPITTVSVALEALQNFRRLNNPQLTEEYLGIAQNELGRLSMLTDKILKTAIYEDKGLALQLGQVNVENLIGQVLASLKLVFEKNASVVSFEKDGNDFTILGDQDHLVNVIYNLIDNSLKYSPSPAILTIILKQTFDGISFSIGDNGPGIPVEFRKKIFEKFFRIPTGDVHNVKGYGLGLNYVESVVKSHKGRIEIETNHGKGTLIVISLPRQ